MKKLLIAASLIMTATFAQADVAWSWWLNDPMTRTDISLGIVNRFAKVSAVELTVLYSGSTMSNGIQASAFGINDSKADCALQLSWWFNRGEDVSAQLAAVNLTEKSAVSFGFVNVAKDSKVQIGLLNFNKNGFLPVFPFINFSKSLFD